MLNHIEAFLYDDHGGAVAEYSLLLVTIAFAMIATMSLIITESQNQLMGTQSRMSTTALTPP